MPSAHANDSGPRPSRTALIVDDDRRTTEFVSKWVRSLGHHVAGVATNGKDAVLLAEKLEFDLLIIDMNMPGMDGVEAAKRIQAKRKVPVIFATAVAEGPAFMRILEASPGGYLVKPYSPAQLKVAIELAGAPKSEPSLSPVRAAA